MKSLLATLFANTIWIATVFAINNVACAQPGNGQGFGLDLAFDSVEFEGVINSINGTQINVQTIDREILVDVSPNRQLPNGIMLGSIPRATIQVTGIEPVSYLKRGMTVQFKAPVDERLNPTGPLTDLQLLSPINLSQTGFQKTGDAGELLGEEGIAGDDDSVLLANVKAVRNNRLTVEFQLTPARKRQLVFEVNDDTFVELQTTDLNYAQKGDHILVLGESPPASPVPMVFGTRISIKRQNAILAERRKAVEAEPMPEVAAAGKPAEAPDAASPEKPDPFDLVKKEQQKKLKVEEDKNVIGPVYSGSMLKIN